jgi:hypothetical protein
VTTDKGRERICSVSTGPINYFSIYYDSQVFARNAVITDLVSVFDSIPFLLTAMGLITSVNFH